MVHCVYGNHSLLGNSSSICNDPSHLIIPLSSTVAGRNLGKLGVRSSSNEEAASSTQQRALSSPAHQHRSPAALGPGRQEGLLMPHEANQLFWGRTPPRATENCSEVGEGEIPGRGGVHLLIASQDPLDLFPHGSFCRLTRGVLQGRGAARLAGDHPKGQAVPGLGFPPLILPVSFSTHPSISFIAMVNTHTYLESTSSYPPS